MKNIKVQILEKQNPNGNTLPVGINDNPLTFIASSDRTKQFAINLFIENRNAVGLSFTDKTDSPWENEPLEHNAVFNDQEIVLQHIDTITIIKDLIDRLENYNAIEFISEEDKQKLIGLLINR